MDAPPKTKLASALKRKFEVKTLEDASNLIYNRLGTDGIAGLTLIVSKLAPSDEVCREILKSAGVTLAELASVVAKRLRMTHDAFTITLVGGTFKAGRYLIQPFRERIRSECPRVKVKMMKTRPALGAFSLAVSELQSHL